MDAADLLAGLGSFQIAVGEGVDFVNFSVFTAPDALFEPDETYTLTLTGASIGSISATENAAGVIVRNDDLPPPVFSLRLIENQEKEGSPPLGGGFAAFAIERVSGAATAATLTYSVTPSGGAPVDAADLLAGLGSFQIAVGEGVDFVNFSVFAAPDALFEPDETYTLTLTGTTVGSISATVNAAGVFVFNDDLPPVNTPPVGVNDSVSTPYVTPIVITVLANDTDADGDALAAGAFANLVGGTLSLPGDGTVLFTPTAGFVGTGGFTYRPFDGTVQGNVTTVRVEVRPATSEPRISVRVVGTTPARRPSISRSPTSAAARHPTWRSTASRCGASTARVPIRLLTPVPIPVGTLASGGRLLVTVALTVDPRVQRFSITERGRFVNPAGRARRFVSAQTVIP